MISIAEDGFAVFNSRPGNGNLSLSILCGSYIR